MVDRDERAFGFSGRWQDYAPIALTNLLLTIVTLGIYRFWATTRTRKYLWSQTRFIDARLEWAGTGKELFVGFLLVALLLGPPLLILNFGVQALALRGHAVIAAAIGFVAWVALFYFYGLARYRALRYRLSRTYWHGIRGGSDDPGLHYGWTYLWKTVVGSLAFGLLIPWAMMSLWNQRWRMLSFGPYAFAAQGREQAAFKRFLLFYLLPVAMVIFFAVALIIGSGAMAGAAQGGFFGAVVLVLGLYVLLGLVALAYYAKFFQEAIGGLSLNTLDFQFDARGRDWLKLILGDVALVVGTLGVGLAFLSYRHWKFLITHLDATGEIDLNALTQSTTHEPKQGEGLLDAFDIGAI